MDARFSLRNESIEACIALTAFVSVSMFLVLVSASELAVFLAVDWHSLCSLEGFDIVEIHNKILQDLLQELYGIPV